MAREYIVSTGLLYIYLEYLEGILLFLYNSYMKEG